MLEMNFNQKDDMMDFVSTNVNDFPNDADDSLPDDTQPIEIRQGSRCDAVGSISEESSAEKAHEMDQLESMTWSTEKRFDIILSRSKDRFKSFRRSCSFLFKLSPFYPKHLIRLDSATISLIDKHGVQFSHAILFYLSIHSHSRLS